MISTLLDPRFKELNFTEPMAIATGLNQIDSMHTSYTQERPSSSRPKTTTSSSSIWDFHDSIEDKAPVVNSSFKRGLELQQCMKLSHIPREDDAFVYLKSV